MEEKEDDDGGDVSDEDEAADIDAHDIEMAREKGQSMVPTCLHMYTHTRAYPQYTCAHAYTHMHVDTHACFTSTIMLHVPYNTFVCCV